jgi:hypothetical protein
MPTSTIEVVEPDARKEARLNSTRSSTPNASSPNPSRLAGRRAKNPITAFHEAAHGPRAQNR